MIASAFWALALGASTALLLEAITTPPPRLPIGFARTLAARTAPARLHLRGVVHARWWILATCVLVFVSPTLGVVGVAAGIPISVVKRRRVTRGRDDHLQGSLAELIDLFAVALLNGHNVTTATREVSRWAPGQPGEVLRRCCARVDRGSRIGDALEQASDELGAAARPLVAALVANERYGAPVSQTLAILASDARAVRRRTAEAAARRLPVAMLFPLVLCILPAFLVLTVVPVLAEVIGSLTA